MKKLIIISSIFLLMLSCSKDDEPTNQAPGAFDLLTAANGDKGIDLKPTFTWKAAVDPEGDAIKYTLYLDTETDPKTVVAENLTSPTFTATDSLHLVTDYHWKVVAKDTKGASVASTVNSFTTRTFNFPSLPVTDNAGFTKRYGHSMVSFKKNLWVIGGYDGSSKKNDVWNSTNGINWKKVSPDIPSRNLFSPRSFHTTVVFDNKLWVIGGGGTGGLKNDVWSSSDGISWTEVTKNAPFTPRESHATVVFQNKLWVIGGYDANGGGNSTNDVWSSDDGEQWVKVTSAAGFSPRSDLSTVVFQDKIWTIGGNADGDKKNDVWSSSDGKNWIEVTKNAEFPVFSEASAVVFDNKIMLLGIYSNDNPSDIWYSKGGKNWLVMKYPNNYLEYPKTALFQNKIWVNNNESKAIWALD